MSYNPRISTMRKFVSDAYPNPTWQYKVQKMSDSQVMAIYYNLKSRKPKKKAKDLYHQITLFECGLE